MPPIEIPDWDVADTPKAEPTDDQKAEQKAKEAHRTALAKFKVSASFFAQQREREMADLKFIDFDEQWDPAVKAQRAGSQTVNGQPPTPARPAITINQLRGPCQQVAAQRRGAKLALVFAPKGAGADQETAEAFEDIARAIQTESRASIARNWAGDRAEKAGMGWYRIDTEYAQEEPTDPAAWNDQDIVYRRILNQASVYPDPFAQEPDFSDGRCLFVTQDLPWDQYKIEFPDSKLAQTDESELTAIGNSVPDFVFTGDIEGHQGKTIRVAEYWEVVETDRDFVMLDDGSGAYSDEIPEGRTPHPKGISRKRRHRRVLWSKINAVEYLEPPVEWNGAYIPLIPVIGEEANVNGERRWQGLVRPGREAAVAYNVMRSAQIETIAMAAKSPWVGYMETIEPYLDWWKLSNTRNFPILPVKAARGPDGAALPPPQRNAFEPAIQAITTAAQMAQQDIHTTTGVPPVALGQLDPSDRSGKAIQALQAQAETGSSGYLSNMVDISMAYEGKVLRDLIPRIYDRPGRIVPAVGIDEKRRMVMVNQPYVRNEKGLPQAIDIPPGQPVPDHAEVIDLTRAQFSVQAVVGKSYNTRREEAATAIGNVLQVVPPEMAAIITPAWLEEQDYPGAKKIAKIAQQALPPAMQSAYEDQQPGQFPPEAQAQIQQLQAQLQQAQAEIQGEQAKVKGQIAVQQVKSQGDAQKAQFQAQVDAVAERLDAQVRIQVAQIQAQTQLVVAEIKAASEDKDRRIQILEAMIHVDKEERLQHQDRGHEAGLTALQHRHERDMAQAAGAQALVQGAQGHQQALEQGDRAHQQALEQGAQAPPLDPNRLASDTGEHA